MELKNKTILIVEDEYIIALMGRKVLENHGFNVIHADSGEKAVELSESDSDIDLILMDIDLGDGIDGTEAAEIILAKRDLPLVFLSSHTEPEIVNKTKSITNYGYVVKNTGDVVLIASIEMALKLFEAKINEALKERQLAYAQQLVNNAFNASIDCYMILKSKRNEHGEIIDFTFLDINVKTEQMLKMSRSDIIGQDLCELLPVNRTSGFFEKYKEVVETGIPLEEEFYLPETHVPAAWYYHQIVRSGDGIFIVHRDITERKDNALQLSLQSLVLNQIEDRVTITDLNGKITYVNDKESEALGYSREELLGQSTDKYGENPERGATQSQILEYTLRDGSWRGEVVNYSSDGKEIIMDCRTQVIHDNDKPVALCGIATDITELKAYENRIKQSENHLRAFLSQLPGTGWLVDSDLKFIISQGAGLKTLGLEPDQVKGMSLYEYFNTDDNKFLPIQSHLQALEGMSVQFEMDFNNITFDTRLSPMYDSNGNITGVVGLAYDISDFKKAQNALALYENSYRRLVESSEDLIFSVDKQGIFHTAGGQKLADYGLTPDDVIGKTIEDIAGDEAPVYYERHNHVFQSGEPLTYTHTFTLNNVTKTDMTTIYPIKDQEGKTDLVGVICKDVTELTEKTKLLQLITDNMFDLVALTDLLGNFTFVGKSHIILGYDVDSLIGKNVMELVHPEDLPYVASAFAEFLQTGKDNKKVEYRIKCVDDSYIWLETVGRFIKDESGEIKELLFSSRDITERKVAEEKLLLALQESDNLREKSDNLLREKEIILKESHHRIKNNMNTIYSLLRLHAEEHNNICSDILNDAAGRIQSMIMLYDKLYRSETPDKLNIKEYITPLIDEILSVVHTGIDIKTDINLENITLKAKTLSSLGIIVNELITNSMKYAFTGKNSGIISINAVKKDTRFFFTYSDNGKGLPDNFSFEQTQTFGIQLIDMLVKQIKGTLRIEKADGMKITIEFDN